jgi:hypothetical protein
MVPGISLKKIDAIVLLIQVPSILRRKIGFVGEYTK